MYRPRIGIACRFSHVVYDTDVKVIPRKNHLCLDTYVQAVYAAGGLPILIPCLPDPLAYKDFCTLVCDGILLPGGSDVSPSSIQKRLKAAPLHTAAHLEQPESDASMGQGMVGEARGVGEVFCELDDLDLMLFDICVEQRKPLLGICRGFHIINVARGGDLVDDLRGLSHIHDRHDLDRRTIVHKMVVQDHNSTIGRAFALFRTLSLSETELPASGEVLKATCDESVSASRTGTTTRDRTAAGWETSEYVRTPTAPTVATIGESSSSAETPASPNDLGQDSICGIVETNSLHHQAIKNLGANLKVTLLCDDGVIEAVESSEPPDLFIVGVQSHPEELIHTIPGWLNLFKDFVDACRRTHPPAS